MTPNYHNNKIYATGAYAAGDTLKLEKMENNLGVIYIIDNSNPHSCPTIQVIRWLIAGTNYNEKTFWPLMFTF